MSALQLGIVGHKYDKNSHPENIWWANEKGYLFGSQTTAH